MGDRTYLTLTIRKQDEALLLAAMRETGDASPNDACLEDCVNQIYENAGYIDLVFEEANYGMTDERTKWAKTVNFTGSHGACSGAYGAMQFVAWNGELIEVDDNDSGLIMCPINDETGEPSPESLAYIKRYLAACKAFAATLSTDA